MNQQTNSSHRIRITTETTSSGDTLHYAVCDAHQWISVGGDELHARSQSCAMCDEAFANRHRLAKFEQNHGVWSRECLFEAVCEDRQIERVLDLSPGQLSEDRASWLAHEAAHPDARD